MQTSNYLSLSLEKIIDTENEVPSNGENKLFRKKDTVTMEENNKNTLL